MSDAKDTTFEEFRDIEGYLGYRVSNLGRVQSCRKIGRVSGITSTWRDLKPALTGPGPLYLAVNLSRDGRPRMFRVHILVLTAFVGPCPDGHWCRHFPDPDTSNNRLSNLQWGTPTENHADKAVQGRSYRGERHFRAKLSDAGVIAIREKLAVGMRQRDIAKEHGVAQARISEIRSGKAWAHVR